MNETLTPWSIDVCINSVSDFLRLIDIVFRCGTVLHFTVVSVKPLSTTSPINTSEFPSEKLKSSRWGGLKWTKLIMRQT